MLVRTRDEGGGEGGDEDGDEDDGKGRDEDGDEAGDKCQGCVRRCAISWYLMNPSSCFTPDNRRSNSSLLRQSSGAPASVHMRCLSCPTGIQPSPSRSKTPRLSLTSSIEEGRVASARVMTSPNCLNEMELPG